MDKLDEIERKIQKARSLLDDVTGGLAKSDIPCRTADIEHIGEALAAISEVQQSIYEQRPELRPEYLAKESPNRTHNQEFGRILVQNEHYLSGNKPREAIGLLNEFKATNPPEEYTEMANNEIERIRRTFNV